jgi:hypothetical protein
MDGSVGDIIKDARRFQNIAAGPQSSNSSSNCSNGRCSRVDTLVIEDARGSVRSWKRLERWEKRRGRLLRVRRLSRDDRKSG